MKGLTLLLLVSLQACHCGLFTINTGSNLNLRGGAKKVVPFKVPPVSPRCKRASSIHLQNLQDKTKDPHVVYKAFNALSLICLDGEKQYRIGKNKNGCEALVETLKVHLHSAKIVLEGLRLATNLAYAQPRPPYGVDGWAHMINQNLLGKLGAFPLFVQAMKRHEGNADIQSTGIRALSNLVFNHSSNCLLAVENRVVETVLSAMAKHEKSVHVQEAGCIFIWTFLVKVVNETHITYGLEYAGCPAGGKLQVNLALAGKVAESGGVERIIKALHNFGHAHEYEREGFNVGEQGCAALSFLSELPGKLRSLIIDNGAIQLAKRVLEAQKDIAPARTWAARLLQQLTGQDFSEHIMKIDVPGPRMDDDVWEDLANGYSKCRRYCGCRGDWDELAPYPGDLESSNSTSTKKKKTKEFRSKLETLAREKGGGDGKDEPMHRMTPEEKKEIARWKKIADVSDSVEAINAQHDWETSQRQAKLKEVQYYNKVGKFKERDKKAMEDFKKWQQKRRKSKKSDSKMKQKGKPKKK